MSHSRKVAEVDASSIRVNFSPRMKAALADLGAAVHFSEHFDGHIKAILEDWSAGKPASVHGVLISLPVIAEETSKHIRATGDKRAEEAWNEIGLAMSEKGFTLTQERQRGKQ